MIIHAVPKFIRSVYAAGNWKAVEANKSALLSIERHFKVVEFDENNPFELLEHCNSNVKHLILEYSFWPDLAEAIKKNVPWIKLHIRTHNAQGFQHWHRTHWEFWPNYENIRSLYGILRLVWQDMRCRRIADTLLGISEWDNKNYWKYLPGRAELSYLPYYSPWPYLMPKVEPLDWYEREDTIICMAGQRDRLGRTMVEGFNLFVKAFCKNNQDTNWKFFVTSGVKGNEKTEGMCPQATILEPLDEPWDLLCKTKAVAVLTPLGFGIKTTVIDALAAGCHVLLHPVLARRLPDAIREQCILYKPYKTNGIHDIKMRLAEPKRLDNFNDSLRSKAVRELTRALL